MTEKSEIVIRQATTSDTSAILNIHRIAFGQDNEANLVEAILTSSQLVKELSILACLESTVAGHVLFSKIGIENNSTDKILALAPVAVLPQHQNNRIGSQIIERGIEVADKLGYSIITVLGEPTYYHRFQFQTSTDFGITCPFKVKPEYFMVLPLSNYVYSHRGQLIYPDHFQTV